MLLPYNAPLNLANWLRGTAPYDVPVRDNAYFDALNQAGNHGLRGALLGHFNRFDGAPDSNYIKECYQNYHNAQTNPGVLTVLYRLRERGVALDATNTTVLHVVGGTRGDAREQLLSRLHTHLAAPDPVASLRNEPFINTIYNAAHSTADNKIAINVMLDEFCTDVDVLAINGRLNGYVANFVQLITTNGVFAGAVPNRETIRRDFFEDIKSDDNPNTVRDAILHRLANAPYSWTVNGGVDIQALLSAQVTLAKTNNPTVDADLGDIDFGTIDTLLDDLIEEHPQINDYYGLECHKLWESYGIYRIDGRHKLDKNMAWALGNIHGERRFRLCSDIVFTSVMRANPNQHQPSAFSNELAALITSGYTLEKAGDEYFLNPPGVALNPSLDDIQNNMGDVYHRLRVLDQVTELLNQKTVILQNERDDTFAPLEARHHRVTDNAALSLDQVEQRVNAQEQALIQRYQQQQPQHGLTTLDDIDHFINQHQHPIGQEQRDLGAINQIRQDRQLIATLRIQDQGIQDVNTLKGDIQAKVNNLLTEHHHDPALRIQALSARLQAVRDDYNLVLHPVGGQQPPDLNALNQTATQLLTDVTTLRDEANGFHYQNINTNVASDLRQQTLQLSTQVFQRHQQAVQQQLQAQQVVGEDNPGEDVEPGNDPGI
jgi:hypothetical protein